MVVEALFIANFLSEEQADTYSAPNSPAPRRPCQARPKAETGQARLLGTLKAKFSAVHVPVNNAGISGSSDFFWLDKEVTTWWADFVTSPAYCVPREPSANVASHDGRSTSAAREW
jgi:hypothetical protein